MHDDLYDGLAPEIVEGTNLLVGRGWSADRVLNEALVGGMRIVGIDFRDGILFVPEVLLAANAMKGGMEILRPLLAETGAPRVGKVVIGTVKGDIHDIGKNLVAMMLEGAGFEVINIGINNAVESYLAALEEHKPDILGMSALLTTTMPYMKVVIDELVAKGIRDDYIVMVGGAPLNERQYLNFRSHFLQRGALLSVERLHGVVAALRFLHLLEQFFLLGAAGLDQGAAQAVGLGVLDGRRDGLELLGLLGLFLDVGRLVLGGEGGPQTLLLAAGLEDRLPGVGDPAQGRGQVAG